MSENSKKLTKKQLKAQQFRKSKEDREQEKDLKRKERDEEEKKEDEKKQDEQTAQPPAKKRRTRRGKGGDKKKKGNRFIIFVGNLPYDVSQTELQAHFKSSYPDEIRIRTDKGIAFLEFDADKDHEHIQRRMDIALLQHKTMFKNRKINVELTVGGGGNSQNRLDKLKSKNEKLEDERRDRMKTMILEGRKKRDERATDAPAGIHPDRAKMIQ